MKSRATSQFWDAYRRLPREVHEAARAAFRLFDQDHAHPSLRFKRVHTTLPVYSVRITRSFRALAVLREGEVVWFWIGSHDDYEVLLKSL